MRNAFAIALCVCSFAAGQTLTPGTNPLAPRYQANKTTVLSGAAETVTVQGTGAAGEAYFEEADVYCSVACTVTFSINGTAATTTTLAVAAVSTATAVPLAAFSSSNVGAGTTLKTFNVAAGQTQSFDMTAFYFPAGAAKTTNLTIATSSITGTAAIQIQWRAK